jgi:hypothetical protein
MLGIAMNIGLRTFFSRAKAPISAALIFLLLLVQGLAASPLLHSDVHEDANSHTHTCAVTILSQGQIDLADPTTPVIPPTPVATEVARAAAPLLLAIFCSTVSTRGPPAWA